ncbi:MAG: CoA-binding protein [Proteobacteria bacterium]|nr:CoA-binding protein [Pseudomonadota bacterium]MBU4470546.1 CoA-binding protein [Pseudomonadota bacterium]MCG2751382.1 CoA-binding protein [Desulfobacteraceae bacterium]
MLESHELNTMFYPKSVALVGASPNPQGWGGTSFLLRLLNIGFPGTIYPIHPKATEVLGLKTYPNLQSIPEPVDLVIIAISAPGVPRILEDCVVAGFKNVHIFSSGFGETGEEEGKKLEQQILEIIKRGNLRVVGPNCMGLYVPASKLAAWGVKPAGTGHVAFLSQSGGHGEILTAYAQSMGVYFSKLISFGNACGLQVADFLEYLHQDPDTHIITMYLEGIKDGNRLTRLIKEINQTKPVIILKAGLTETGSRAVASHTGSLAGEGRIWDAFFKQTGAIRVNSLEEIIDVVLAFLYLKPTRGKRALVLGGGGGNSVAFADICGRQGLDIPPFSENTRKELNEFIRLAGNSTRNPLDVWMVQRDVKLYRRVMEIAMSDPSIDLAIIDRVVGGLDVFDDDERPEGDHDKGLEEVNDFLIDFAKKNPFGKPLVVSANLYGNDLYCADNAAQLRRKFVTAGVPAYASFESAARAMVRFINYHEFLAQFSSGK